MNYKVVAALQQQPSNRWNELPSRGTDTIVTVTKVSFYFSKIGLAAYSTNRLVNWFEDVRIWRIWQHLLL